MLIDATAGNVAGIVLAAGLSSRMGAFKLLLPYAENTIIETTVGNLREAGVDKIIIVTGHRGDEIEQCFGDRENIHFVKNDNYKNGEMLESVQLGLREAANCDAAYVIPGDMPAVAISTFVKIRKYMFCTKASVAVPLVQGKQKHPPLIRRRCFSDICDFAGNGGLRVALQQFSSQTISIPVKDIGCTMDADTWADYMKLQEYQGKRILDQQYFAE